MMSKTKCWKRIKLMRSATSDRTSLNINTWIIILKHFLMNFSFRFQIKLRCWAISTTACWFFFGGGVHFGKLGAWLVLFGFRNEELHLCLMVNTKFTLHLFVLLRSKVSLWPYKLALLFKDRHFLIREVSPRDENRTRFNMMRKI